MYIRLTLTEPLSPRPWTDAAASDFVLGSPTNNAQPAITARWNPPTTGLPPTTQPWIVLRAHLVEELGELPRCELVMGRLENLPPAPNQAQKNQGFFDNAGNELQNIEDMFDQVPTTPGSPFGQEAGPYLGAWQNVANAVTGGAQRTWNDAMGTPGNPGAFTDWDQFQQDVLGLPGPQAPWIPDPPPFAAKFLGAPRSVLVAQHDGQNGPLLHGRWFTGVGWEFEDLGLRSGGARIVRLVLASDFERLALRRGHRIFREQTALEIADAILKETKVLAKGGLDVDQGVKLKKRTHTVQYGETDLDFLLRIFDEDGLVLRFDHACGAELVRVTAAAEVATSAHPVEVTDDNFTQGTLIPAGGFNASSQEGFTSWRAFRRLAPTAACVRSFNFTDLPGSMQEPGFHPTDARTREAFDPESANRTTFPLAKSNASLVDASHHFYPGRTDFHFDPALATQRDDAELKGQAARALARLRADACTAEGTTNAVRVRAGKTVDLDMGGRPLTPYEDALNPEGVFLLRRVEALAEDMSSAGLLRSGNRAALALNDLPDRPDGFKAVGAIGFEARVEMLRPPARMSLLGEPALPVVPRRERPRPRIEGTQSAPVSTGQETDGDPARAFADVLGRVTVALPWDRPSAGPRTLVPVRVASPWAGRGFGLVLPARSGDELLLSYMDGDPTQPVALGALYSFNRPAPIERPHLEVVDNNNHLGEDGEDIYEKDRLHYRLNDEMAEKGDHVLTMIRTRSHPAGDGGENKPRRSGTGFHELSFDDTEGKERLRIHSEGTLTELVKRDHRLDVEEDRLLVVQGAHTETIDKDQHVEVEGTRTKIIDGHETERVSGKKGRTEKIFGIATQHVEGSLTQTVSKDEITKVKGESGDDDDDDDPIRTLKVDGGRQTVVEKGNDVREVGGSVLGRVHGVYELSGAPLNIKGGGGKPGSASVTAEDGAMVIDGGDEEATIEAPGLVRLQAPKVRVQGAKEVRLEAGDDVTLVIGPEGVHFSAPQGIKINAGATEITNSPHFHLHVPKADEGESGGIAIGLAPNEDSQPFPSEGMKDLFDSPPGMIVTGDVFRVSGVPDFRLAAPKVRWQQNDDLTKFNHYLTGRESELLKEIRQIEGRLAELDIKIAQLEKDEERLEDEYDEAHDARSDAGIDVDKVEGKYDNYEDAKDDFEEAKRDRMNREAELEELEVELVNAELDGVSGDELDDIKSEIEDKKKEVDEAKQHQAKMKDEKDRKLDDYERAKGYTRSLKSNEFEALKELDDTKQERETREEERELLRDELVMKKELYTRLTGDTLDGSHTVVPGGS